MRKSFLVEIENDNVLSETSLIRTIVTAVSEVIIVGSTVKVSKTEVIEKPCLGTFTVIGCGTLELNKMLNESALNGHSEIVSHVVIFDKIHVVVLREAERD